MRDKQKRTEWVTFTLQVGAESLWRDGVESGVVVHDLRWQRTSLSSVSH
jgi:hypothetical protein